LNTIKRTLFFLAGFFVLQIFAAPPVQLFAQTAARLEALLNKAEITWADAAGFVLEASENLSNAGGDDAFRFAAQRNWLPKNAASGDTARFDGTALLLMQSFGFKGGIFFGIGKSPHHAYREMVYKGVIKGDPDPRAAVSGRELLLMINRILAMKEKETQKPAKAPKVSSKKQAEEEKLVQEINAMLVSQKVADTTAKITDEGVTISLSNIQFRANSVELVDSEKAKIREIARILNNVPERRLLVAGHTAQAGTREEQLRTSQARAQSVADYLISLGTRTRAEITVQGFGADRPVADNATTAGMAQNRRVEITIPRSEGAR